MSGWHRAIAFALTGSDLDLGEQEAPDLDVLVEQLDRNGWDADERRLLADVPPHFGRA